MSTILVVSKSNNFYIGQARHIQSDNIVLQDAYVLTEDIMGFMNRGVSLDIHAFCAEGHDFTPRHAISEMSILDPQTTFSLSDVASDRIYKSLKFRL